MTRSESDVGQRHSYPSVSDAPDSAAVTGLARVGRASYGVVHLLVAWLVLQVAWGIHGGAANQSGAMSVVAATTVGPPLLWVLAIGLTALALWQLGELRWLWRRASSSHGHRAAVVGTVESVGKAAVYLGLAVLAHRFATSTGTPSTTRTQHTTSGGLAPLRGGRLIVGATALVVAGVGVRQWVTGLRQDFLDEVDTTNMPDTHRRLIG